MKLKRICGVAAVMMAVALSGSAFAVRPSTFVHQTEEDFAEGGTFENTVINNYGELTLGREIKAITTGDKLELTVGVVKVGADMFAAVATSKGNEVLRWVDRNEPKSAFKLAEEDGIITAIGLSAKGEILIATSDGKQAKVQKLGEEKGGSYEVQGVVFEKKGVENIWAIEKGPDGKTYVATGPKGMVFAIGDDGKAEAVLEEAGKNVIAIGFDKKGNLIAGTDGDGLVIRAEKDKKPFVLYEAGEGIDITAIAVDEAGNIYAGKAKSEADLGDFLPPMGAGSKSKPGVAETEPMEDAEEDVPTPESGKKVVVPPKHVPVAPKSETQPKKIPTTKPVESGMREMDRLETSATLQALVRANTKMDRDVLGSGDISRMVMPRETYFVAEKNDFLTAMKGAPAATKKGIKSPKGMGPMNPGLRKYLTPKLGPMPEVESANGVMKISADGNVTSIFGGSDMVMSLLMHKGPHGEELIIGTGNEGKIFSYGIEQEAEAMVARVKEESVTALAVDKDGAVIVGTSDRGQIYTLSPNLAAEGKYVSKVLDASRSATFGTAQMVAVEKGGTSASVATRSGNVADVSTKEKFWSDWTAESNMKEDKGTSPAARYVQYRVTLKGDGKESSPTVDSVKIAYASKNLPPRLKNLAVDVSMTELPGEDKSADAAPPEHEATISWEASDPNSDTLAYRLYYKPADAKDETWTPIVKDLRETTYAWSTTAVPDGMYQVKVVASDALDNAADEAKSVARVTPAFRIDHTPPEIGDLKAEVNEGKVTVMGSAKDGLSSLSEVRFQVDGAQDWQVGKASDTLIDSPSEAFTLTTRQLSAGGHRITVRVMDVAGNCAYKAVSVTVK